MWEMEAGINSLCNNKSLVKRPADKGEALWYWTERMCEMYRIVGDRETYTPLASDPLAKYKKDLEKITDGGLGRCILNK